MRSLELANQYMEIFYESGDPDSLAEILSEDCLFRGPFYQFDTASAYIKSLKSDPPEGLSYRIIEAFESKHAACLVYEFSGKGVSTIMSQTFRISGDKISGILLVFDTGDFHNI
ncbi:nuclear transport factor 2 family protein [Kaarinaea lacus]